MPLCVCVCVSCVCLLGLGIPVCKYWEPNLQVWAGGLSASCVYFHRWCSPPSHIPLCWPELLRAVADVLAPDYRLVSHFPLRQTWFLDLSLVKLVLSCSTPRPCYASFVSSSLLVLRVVKSIFSAVPLISSSLETVAYFTHTLTVSAD